MIVSHQHWFLLLRRRVQFVGIAASNDVGNVVCHVWPNRTPVGHVPWFGLAIGATHGGPSKLNDEEYGERQYAGPSARQTFLN